MKRPAWAKKAYRIATLHRECIAAGGHTRSGEISTATMGGREVEVERCSHCTVRGPVTGSGWKENR